ncbi:hypothetical protein [Sphingosinicella humi]|uniref:Uncharacterized protein n=1 Tax=Allosphingosinicella humi TaxID=2068657 RepID=A0A2U2J0X2_9SPHN|nr:hypothetical protein [Sphingosinicella humi]PWG01990.1 hypothetical protein DF286_03250 [Sphingosinicella humi]
MAEAFEEQLVGVPPHLWPQTLERAAIIAKYLKIANPTVADVDEHARKLGIRRRYFYVLVRIFRERRAARTIDIDKQYKRAVIDPEASATVEEVIAELGPDAKLAHVKEEVQRRCRDRGITLPSSTTIRTRLNAARVVNPGTNFLPDLIVDHCGLKLQATDPNGVVETAVLTALIHTPTGRVMGHYLGLGSPGATAMISAINNALSQPAGAGCRARLPVELRFHAGQEPIWDTIIDALQQGGIKPLPREISDRSAGRSITRVLGLKLGRIPFAPRATFKAPQSVRGFGTAVSLDQVRLTVAEILDQRNASLPSNDVASLRDLLGRNAARQLEKSLAGLPNG